MVEYERNKENQWHSYRAFRWGYSQWYMPMGSWSRLSTRSLLLASDQSQINGPVKMELPNSEWTKAASGQGISLPYFNSAASFVSGLPVDQRYPFIMPGQYVAQMPYPQQFTPLGSPAAPNVSVQPHTGMIAPQQRDKKPHIKKPLNAFMLFVKEKRAVIKEKRADVIKEFTFKEYAATNQMLVLPQHMSSEQSMNESCVFVVCQSIPEPGEIQWNV